MTAERNAFRDTVKHALTDQAEKLFQDLIGQPERLGAKDWRAKGRSSFKMTMRGPNRGLWNDFKSGEKGDGFELIAVYLCGLDRAGANFPLVLEQAASWAGVTHRGQIDLKALQAKKDAIAKEAREAEARDAASRAELIKQIISRAQPIEGTPAAAYLASRRISALPRAELAYLPPVPDLASEAMAGANHPALLVWACDATGTPMGGQRILITPNGAKAAIPDPKKGKPFFAVPKGNPARFAARIEGGPLCVCEGPESALSVWQATGFETWAVFGASNWATAPLPRDRKVILCPDQDAPVGTYPAGSEDARRKEVAAKQFDAATAQHSAAGVDLWTARAPEPEGSKSDLNDTLQRAGNQAVRDAIAGAVRYGSTPPDQPDPRGDRNNAPSEAEARFIPGNTEPTDAPRRPLPKPAALDSGRRVDLLTALQNCTPETALSVAVAVAHKLQDRAPLIYDADDIAEIIETNTPAGYLTRAELAQIKDRVQWLLTARRREAIEPTQIHPDARARHDVRSLPDLEGVNVADFQGVMLVRSPMGSGKTQKIGRPFIQDALARGRTAMAVAHRVTLISELSQRLGLPDYRQTTPEIINAAGGVAVCLPSTTRGDIAEAMPAPDCLFIDEVAQVLQFLADGETCRSGAADSRGVYNRLAQIVRDAGAVIVADADIDTRVVQFLEECRPGERFLIVEVEPKATGKRAVLFDGPDQVLEAVTVELHAGGKAWLACEGRMKAEAYAAAFEAQGFRAICITAGTKQDAPQVAFLTNPETESLQYDIVVSSPAISSGMSIEHRAAPHFTLGGYIGVGARTRPADAKQQISRVRYLTRFVIGLGASNLTGGQNVETLRAGAEGAAEIERLETKWTDFDTYVAGVNAESKNVRADFSAGLWWQLEAAGWQVERKDTPDGVGCSKASKAITKAAKEAHIEAVLSAEPITNHQGDILETMARNSEQEARRTAHQIRKTLGKFDLTPDDVTFWDDGRGKGKIVRFEDLIGAEVNYLPDTDILSQSSFRTTRRKLYGVVFNGIDLTAPISADDAETILDRVMVQPHVYAACGIVGPKYAAKFRGAKGGLMPTPRPKQAGREVREILERCGLQVSQKRVRSVPKPYSVLTTEERFGTEDNREYRYQVSPESWAFMAGILERREVFDLDAALARADRTYPSHAPHTSDRSATQPPPDVPRVVPLPVTPAPTIAPPKFNESREHTGPPVPPEAEAARGGSG